MWLGHRSFGRSCEERLKDVQGREGGSACRKHDNGKVLEAAPAKEPDAVARVYQRAKTREKKMQET